MISLGSQTYVRVCKILFLNNETKPMNVLAVSSLYLSFLYVRFIPWKNAWKKYYETEKF